jgi:hypothetical protein
VAFRADLKVKSIILKDHSIFQSWVSSIDLEKIRVTQFPSYIFLCGGRISATHESFDSCRDIFYTYIKKNNCSFSENIVLAEDVIGYFEDTDYKDLLSFEKDLASLSLLTVIFSESPGAIAELGSFSVLEYIQDRLLIVLHTEHSYDQNSFIWRGPISYLKGIAKEKGSDDPVLIYKWKKIDPCSDGQCLEYSDFSDASDLSEYIEGVIKKRNKSITFNKGDVGHIMLFIASVLNVIQIVTVEEMNKLLYSFGFERKISEVKKYLDMLVSLKLISLAPYRNYKFFVANSPQKDWLKWGYHKSGDKDRWSARFLEYYEEYQKEKFRALRSYFNSRRTE